MASRLERFKAATKNDLDKLPDKPNPIVTETPTSEKEDTECATALQSNNGNGCSHGASTTRDGQVTSPTADLNELPVLNSTLLDSDDDSEAGCHIEIEAIDEDETSAGVTTASDDKLTKPKLAQSSLGPRMRFMQVTTHGEQFCPILAIAKYPYKYVQAANSQAVASAFFDKGQFWSREWDLFYAWPIEAASKPIIFVREEQFAQLLREIRERFPNFQINPKEAWFRHIRLVTAFPNHPRLLPRYLGRSMSRDNYDSLLLRVPPQRPSIFPPGEPEPERAPAEDEIADFNDICETAVDLARQTRRGKNKGQEAKVIIQANPNEQLKRAQRYFGVRKIAEKEDCGMPAFDIHQPPPFELEDDVIIICVDVEAWERSHSIITEVGIATLDTRDIKDLPPGTFAENWRPKIRARHLRIREHMMYENHEFCQGNADRFEEEFGKTEIVDEKDICRVIASCFKEPYSKVMSEQDVDASRENLSSVSSGASEEVQEKRNIIFLGHNTATDVSFLHQLGYNPENLSNLQEYMDTASLFRAHKKEPQPRSVGGILMEFDITGWGLHNAGNDAVYTLQIMMAIVVAEAQARSKNGEKDDDGDEDKKLGKEKKVVDEKITGAGAQVAPAKKVVDVVILESCKRW